MAGKLQKITTAEIQVTGGTPLWVLRLEAVTNQRLVVHSWNASFDGVSPTAEPVLIEIFEINPVGTWTATITPVKLRRGLPEAPTSVGHHTATGAPTAGDILDRENVHPQSGWKQLYPPGRQVEVSGGTSIAAKITAAATVNVVFGFEYEE